MDEKNIVSLLYQMNRYIDLEKNQSYIYIIK